jgi:hypothetical protein
MPPPKSEVPATKISTAQPAASPHGTVSIFLSAGPEPDKQGLGAVYPLITHASGGREIKAKMFTERLLVSRAIGKSDQLTLRFLGSLLLVEFLVRWNQECEIGIIHTALLKHLGSPWPFHANWSFLTVELARNELTAALDNTGIFGETKNAPAPWFILQCDKLAAESSLWQWNPRIAKTVRRPKSGTSASEAPTA